MKAKRTMIILMLLVLCAGSITGCGNSTAETDVAVRDNVDIVGSTLNSGDVPEDIQTEGMEIKALADLPQYKFYEQEISVLVDEQNIYGIAYVPDTGNAKMPLIICSHGLGGSYRSCAAYAEQLAAHGIAAYCFDFRGGGGSRSDGSTTEMSVMTEVSDLEAVMNAAKGWDFVDGNRIALLGTSQGGIVSAITAARHADDAAGLILCYPAFLVQDTVHERFDSLDEVPDSFQFEWITAGRPYIEDMWDYDVYAEIGNYAKPVLLMHGDADSIVPLSYAERAAELYPDVDYFVINGAGHGFSGAAFEEAMTHIFAYVQKIGLILMETHNDNSEANYKSVRMTVGDTAGYVKLYDNKTAKAFLDMLPLTIQMSDLHGREYWFSHSVSYDEQDVVHDYAPGQLTYWCGGWVTVYYDRDDDDVIEDGSVVIGIMDDVLIEKFSSLNGESVEVSFDIADQ